MLQWTLALWIPRFTGTLIIRTAAESPIKITDILTETNSRCYTDLLIPLLVPTWISISTFWHFGRIISDHNIFLPLPLFVSVTLVEFKWTFWFPFITWCFYETMVFTCKKSHDVLTVHKLDFLVPYFTVFGYKLQGSGGWSFNWLMHYHLFHSHKI